jgi:triacylglycerol esterase/lipase EstA (alpha/beta hydrolase family)
MDEDQGECDIAPGGIHLIVLIHGLYGNPSNLAVVKDELKRASSLAKSSIDRSLIYTKDDRDADENGEVEEVDMLLGRSSRNTGRRIMFSRVLVLQSFEGSHTWDGVDINAQRASTEVRHLNVWSRCSHPVLICHYDVLWSLWWSGRGDIGQGGTS